MVNPRELKKGDRLVSLEYRSSHRDVGDVVEVTRSETDCIWYHGKQWEVNSDDLGSFRYPTAEELSWIQENPTQNKNINDMPKERVTVNNYLIY